MSIDYIVASLPVLAFGAPAPMTWEAFAARAAEAGVDADAAPPRWTDLETQLRNAVAESRGGARFRRPAVGCSLFWRKRVADCFAEKDVARRDELLDRVWWDAAEELADPADPLGRGALERYAVRLRIAIRRGRISREAGNAAFDRLTAETRDVVSAPAAQPRTPFTTATSKAT